MTKPRHIIELNGKRYDAQTGKLLGSAKSHSPAKHAHTPQPHHPAHSVHRQKQRAKTLMRHAVKKPQALAKNHQSDKHPAVVTPHAAINPDRLKRAQDVPQSSRISKFTDRKSAVQPMPTVLPVQPEPEGPPPAPLVHQELPTIPHESGRPDFHKALEHARSHTLPRHQKTTRRQHASQKLRVSPRILNIAAVSMAVLLLGGFYAWQNAPNLSMRLARAQADVNATLPDYQPAGFGLSGPIQYEPGQVTVTYRSRSDTRMFRINQRTSAWTDAALRRNLETNQVAYQTLEGKGKTIHIYNGSNATWVENGVWYQIEGDSSLNSHQLLRLATSM